MARLLSKVLTSILCMAALSSVGFAQTQLPSKTVLGIDEMQLAVEHKLDVKQSTLQDLAFETDFDGNIHTTVVIDGEDMHMVLEPHSLRSANFKLFVQYENGSDPVEIEAPAPKTYLGRIEGHPDMRVRASVIGDGIKAMIFTPDRDYGIDPVTDLGLSAQPATHAVYASDDWLNTDDLSCGVDDNAPFGIAMPSDNGFQSVQRQAAGTGFEIAEIGIDTDALFVNQEGGVIGALEEVEQVMNTVEGVYENGSIGITYEITTVILRTVLGPYSNPGDIFNLLCQFRSTWNTSPENSIQRDIAHLFTGQNLSGGIIGVAWLGTVCNQSLNVCSGGGNAGYGLSENLSNSTSEAGLTAHELGHNWGSGHCDGSSGCRIMCSGLGGCNGLSPLTFGGSATSAINSFKNSVSCLDDLAPVVQLPFCDEFAASIDDALWSHVDGASISTAAVNPPTPPFVLRVNATGSGTYQDDEIRSNFVDLSGQTDVLLTFLTQHIGVGSGETLFVEYWSIQDEWVEVAALVSDGVDQTEFEFHEFTLPIIASHNEFRLRFRAEVSGSGDNWYIDNVGLDCFCEDPCSDSDPCTIGDACDGILCTGSNVDCSAFDDECSVGACSANGADGNCDLAVPANEGAVCGGGTGICTDGTCLDLTNSARLFMAQDGAEGGAASVGPTALTMAQGTTATVSVFYEDTGAAGTQLNAYQIMFQDTAIALPGATGAVTYVDNNPGGPAGDSVDIDTARNDWIFNEEPMVLPFNLNETPALGVFGVFYSTLPGTGPDPTTLGLRYVAEFQIAASPDALGQFQWTFNSTQPPVTNLFNPLGALLGVEQLQPLIVNVIEGGGDCVEIADCADLDDSGIRDDSCVFWECVVGNCVSTDISYADMGGPNGDCLVDGTSDGNDRFHALNCFSNQNTLGGVGYPCEPTPPAAMNVDAAGLNAPCTSDGVCDGNDAFAALNAFSGTTTCSCDGPAPSFAPQTVSNATLRLLPRSREVMAGELLTVDVYTAAALKDLRGYQLHVGTRADQRQALELLDIAIEQRGSAFGRLGAWEAFNIQTAQMVAGLDQAGVPVAADTYLASFTFRVSPQAFGDVVIELLHDPDDSSHRTVLFPTAESDRIDIVSSASARVTVTSKRTRSSRISRR